MSYTIMFRRKALVDYDEARDWYHEKSPDLKIRFEKAISEGLKKNSLTS